MFGKKTPKKKLQINTSSNDLVIASETISSSLCLTLYFMLTYYFIANITKEKSMNEPVYKGHKK